MECPSDCASREAVVMTSVDGETWVRAPSGPEFRVAQPGDLQNAPGAAMFKVVAWGSRFAALGEYDGEPTVWVATPEVREDVPTPALPEPAPSGQSALAYGVDGDFFLADPDGSNAVKIADGVPRDHCASIDEFWFHAEGSMWSPDGRYLPYRYTDCSSEEPGTTPENWGGVVISDAAGNVLVTFPAAGWDIAWSPDSSRVAVWDTLFETIGVYGVDGVRQTQLMMPFGWQPTGDHDPVWMLDGTSLVVQNVELPLDGGTPPDDYPGEEIFSPLGGSPDGSHTAYVDHQSLMVARWDGSGSVTLLTVERGTTLGVIGFSPEGDRILFWRNEDQRGDPQRGELWSVGVDGSDARLVVAGTIQGEWRPR